MKNFLKEEAILSNYLKEKGLRQGRQRVIILHEFLFIEKHVSPEELWSLLKANNPEIGIATVYRTLKLLTDCGLAKEVHFAEKGVRYEHLYGHTHHDHLVCTKCNTVIEVVDPEIERLQESLAKRNNFKVEAHRMEIYGLCSKCRG